MGAQNYTSTVHLPQFGPTDKPSWQGDVNQAFKAINDAIAERDGIIANLQAQINTLMTKVN